MPAGKRRRASRYSGGATSAQATAWIAISASGERVASKSGAHRYRIGEKWNVKWLPFSVVLVKPWKTVAMLCVNSPRSEPE